jgi:hypothetical protein
MGIFHLAISRTSNGIFEYLTTGLLVWRVLHLRHRGLTSLKSWRPLREERIRPFAKIGGPAASRDGAAFVLHLRLKAALCA